MPRLVVLTIIWVLAGCGGGGGGGGSGGTSGGACSVADEKSFVLSTTQDWYFFNSPDFPGQTAKYNGIDLASYATADDLLEFLRYQPTQFDRGFSFITTIAEEQQFLQGQFVGFGFGTKFVDAPVNDDLRFTRVFSGSPAEQAGFQRGDRILELDGRTIAEINQAEGVTAAFGPAQAGFTVDFLIRDKNGSEFNVQVAKATVTIDPVPPVPTRIIDLNGRPVGYINFRSFISAAEPALDSIFAQFQAQNVRDVIIDVRYNGGGLVSVAEHLGDLLGGAALPAGTVFSRTLFNPARAGNDSERRFARLINSLAMLDSLTFITTGASASASELMINSFSPHTTVVVVGSLTDGKPVGQSAFDYCGTQRLRLVTFETVNALDQGRYFGGIPADCPAADDLNFVVGDVNEASLAAALTRIDTGQCPPQPALQKPQFARGVAEVPKGVASTAAQRYLAAF